MFGIFRMKTRGVTSGMLAFHDTGTLVVGEDSLDFDGKKNMSKLPLFGEYPTEKLAGLLEASVSRSVLPL